MEVKNLHPLRLWLCNTCLLSNHVPVLAICCKDSAKPCMHLYLNCIWNKNSTQSLFRDISWCCCCWCCEEAS